MMPATLRQRPPAFHVRPRATACVRLAHRLGCSERQAKALLYTTFITAAAIVEELRDEPDRLAHLMAPLSAALAPAGSHTLCEALRAAQDADSDEDRAELAFLLDRTPELARAALHAKAAAMLHEEKVLPLLREAATR